MQGRQSALPPVQGTAGLGDHGAAASLWRPASCDRPDIKRCAPRYVNEGNTIDFLQRCFAALHGVHCGGLAQSVRVPLRAAASLMTFSGWRVAIKLAGCRRSG
jgi:hypothetical protein